IILDAEQPGPTIDDDGPLVSRVRAVDDDRLVVRVGVGVGGQRLRGRSGTATRAHDRAVEVGVFGALHDDRVVELRIRVLHGSHLTGSVSSSRAAAPPVVSSPGSTPPPASTSITTTVMLSRPPFAFARSTSTRAATSGCP